MKQIKRPEYPNYTQLAIGLSILLTVFVQSHVTAQTPEPGSAVNAPGSSSDDETVKLSSFVVVGSTIDKTELESANSIATLDRAQIERISPRSTADLLSQIPGIYVEPTAGQISNNYYIRGLPSGGGTRFLGLIEDGLPILANNSDFTFRGDALTVSDVEILRGGASSILTSYAAGGTVNFRTREGSENPAGAARLTFSDYGQIREDAYYGGPLGKNLTYFVGGYYNTDSSQRDTGWGKVDQGGQVVANLRYNFPDHKGYFKINGRYLDDQSAYFATELYQNQKHPQTIPGGPDILNGTFYGPEFSSMTIWTGNGPIQNNFSQGVPVRMKYLGTELKYQFGDDWTVLNRNRVTDYFHKFNGLFGGNTVDGTGNALASYGIPILINSAAAKPGFSNLKNYASYQVTDAVTGALINPTTMNGNGAIQLIYPMDEFGYEKDLQNDFQLQKTIGPNTITGGFYYSRYKQDFTQFGNQALTDVTNHAHLLNVQLFDAGGNSLGSITDNGFTQYGSWYTRIKVTQDNLAPYVTDEIKLGNWRFDAGWRSETVKQKIDTGPQSSNGFISRPVNQHNPALYGGTTVAPGDWTRVSISDRENSVSLGANYKLTEATALYGRYSVSGYLTPPANGIATPAPRITQIELGYRGYVRSFVWNVTLFDSEATNNSVNIGTPVNGNLVFSNQYLKTRDYGVETLATWDAFTGFSLDFQGTFSRSGYKGSGSVQGADGAVASIDGKRPVRQPDTMFSATARYKIPVISNVKSQVFVTNAYIGKRASDIANAVWLPSYNVVNAGLLVNPRKDILIKVQVSNFFNESGLTEGNPRQSQVVGNANAVYYGARAIFGRSFQASIEYQF
ncbi:MAG TPA: TonB-dependent receptor [Opitutaceae bacterium]|nr:TonB-dependent receptor [Opitutaceae bacterium]